MEGNESNQGMSGLCKAGCGFYGNSSNDGLCSLCFKNKLRKSLQFQDTQTGANNHATSSHADDTVLSGDNVDTDQTQISGAMAMSYVNSTNSYENNASSDPSSNLPSSSSSSLQQTPSFTLDIVKRDLTKEFEDKIDEKINGKIKTLNLDDIDTTKMIAENEDENDSMISKDKKKNKCYICKKKVGLTGFGCRCGGLFCGLHRYSDTHNCTFDYKEQGQKEIQKNNPRVTYEKIAKI